MAQQIKTALVVDDSRLARIALCKLLKNRGIEAEVAGNGTEGLDYLRTTTPDVVFMDYMMPDMDGFEASRRVLSDPACGQPPIVMYTSQDTDEDRAKAREIGIAGFLSKPTSEAALDDVLTALANGAAQKPAAVAAAAAPAVAPAPVAADPAPAAEVVSARAAATAGRADPEAARAVALEAAERVAQRFFEQLRDELAATSDSILRQATEAAERSAAAAVDAAAARLATAQEPIDVDAVEVRVREAAEAAAKQTATTAARALSPSLIEDARNAAAEAVEAADLQGRLQKLVQQEALPALRKDLSAAAQQAAEAAVRSGLDAQVAMLDSRMQEAAKQAAAAETKAARGGLITVAVVAGVVAGLVAGAVAGFLF